MIDPLVKPKHCNDLGYCMQQVRPWLVKNGFDITTFVRQGIPASELEATGDGLAIAIAEHARKIEADHG